jgi:DNA-binding NarL/FixJ family response regulator
MTGIGTIAAADPRKGNSRTEAHGEISLARLTSRERDVLELLARGNNSREISQNLVISRHTARTHIQRVLSKLGVHSRLEATALVYRDVAASPGGE